MATSLVACSSGGESKEQRSSAALDAKVAEEPAAPEPEVVNTSAQPAVIEIDVGETAVDGVTVPIAPVAPTPKTLEWTEQASVDEALVFIPFTGGVIARSPSGLRELDAETGALVARPELEVPETGELIGYWPDSAWHIEVEPIPADEVEEGDERRFYYQMSTFDRGEWTVERRRGAKRWRDGEIQFRKGWHGGLLLRNDANITRIGSRRGKPRAGARKGKELVDMFETRAGRLYTISERDGAYWVQANCDDLDCVEANARRLPRGTGWSFSMQSPRRSNDGSMLATLRSGESEVHYLLSYDDHEWMLEPLAEVPKGMWPDDKGGLWLIVGSALLHRARDGSWATIELPGEGAWFSAAMTVERDRLWLSRGNAGGATIYTTPANPA